MQQQLTKKSNQAEKVLTGIYCFYAIATLLTTFYFISQAYHLGPFRDMWIAMDFIRGFFEGNTPWHEAFSLHGGAHRLALPKLFFLIEYGIFNGSNTFLITASIMFQLCTLACVYCAIKQETYLSSAQKYLFLAVTTVLLFNTTQLENFIYTFDMQWFATASAAVISLYCWVQLFRQTAFKFTTNNAILLSAALLASLFSLFSSFSGLCLLLILPLLTIVYRLRPAYIVGVIIINITMISLYLSGPFAEGGSWVGENTPEFTLTLIIKILLSWFVLWVKWLALYFGAPLSRHYFWLAAACAYMSLLFLAWQWLSLLRHGKQQKTVFQIWALSIALFAAAVGAATGMGRLYVINTASEDRYQTIVLIYWLGLFAYAFSNSLWLRQQKKPHYFAVSLAFILFWTTLVIPVSGIKDARAQLTSFNRVNNTNLAIAIQQYDFKAIKATLILGDKIKKINRPAMHADFLASQGWGIFHQPIVQLLNKPWPRFSSSSKWCDGQVTTINPLSMPYIGQVITGHIQLLNKQQTTQHIIALDSEHILRGLGRVQRIPKSLWPINHQKKNNWRLYATGTSKIEKLFYFAQLSNGRLCPLPDARSIFLNSHK